MANRKYDWDKLKGEFVRGDILTIDEFLKSKGISHNGHVDTIVAGWLVEREEYVKKLEEETTNKTLEAVSETTAQVRARQQRMAKILQAKGLKGLKDKVPDTVGLAGKFLIAGLREEREALDLNKHAPVITGAINIAVLNTRFGKMIQGLNYEQLQRVLERLKELDSRRDRGVEPTGSVPDGAIEGELLSE